MDLLRWLISTRRTRANLRSNGITEISLCQEKGEPPIKWDYCNNVLPTSIDVKNCPNDMIAMYGLAGIDFECDVLVNRPIMLQDAKNLACHDCS